MRAVDGLHEILACRLSGFKSGPATPKVRGPGISGNLAYAAAAGIYSRRSFLNHFREAGARRRAPGRMSAPHRTALREDDTGMD